MLVPDTPDLPTQMLDARDLASWLIDCAERGTTGTFNAVGPVQPFAELIAVSREVGGHHGDVVLAPSSWLLEHEVNEFMGPESLALWIVEPGWDAFADRSGAAAAATGLRARPLPEMLTDLLAWERSEGLDRERRAGLSQGRERELLAAFGG